ncbi:MAG: hypothetical protein GEU93_13030 [Propionibacteriales bacterium]|nr:hypothetical protein [Propionibacteriales bacterium]
MTPLLPARRRAEEFARLVDGHQQTADPVLQSLLDTVSTLRQLPPAGVDPQFHDDLRARLMDAAAAELPARRVEASPVRPASVPRTGPRALRRRRLLVATATSLVLVGGGAGVATASQQALPGDMLYPVKRTLENARLSFADGGIEHGQALIERSRIRLREAEQVSTDDPLTQHDIEALQLTFRDFAADTTAAREQLLAGYADTGETSGLTAAREFAAEAHSTLGELGPQLPRQLQPSVVRAARSVVTLDHTIAAECPTCASDLPALELESVLVELPTLAADAPPNGLDPPLADAFGAQDQTDRAEAKSGQDGPARKGARDDQLTSVIAADPAVTLPELSDLDPTSPSDEDDASTSSEEPTSDEPTLLERLLGIGSSTSTESPDESVDSDTSRSPLTERLGESPVLKSLQ